MDWMLRSTKLTLFPVFFCHISIVLAAGAAVTVPEDYPARLRASSAVATLAADDMFGDRVGLFTGSLEFLQTDLVVPGTGLDIVVSRRLVAGSLGGTRLFADWDLAIPSIHGVFSTQGGWNSGLGGRNLNRCSKYAWPIDEYVAANYPGKPTHYFQSDEFWHGTFLYLPATGDEEVLKTIADGPPKPSGASYPLRTKSGAVIRCISMAGNEGEGYEVLTPEGVTYRFDHMVKRGMVPIIKFGPMPGGGNITNPARFVLDRTEYYLFPTSARDRFGNYLNFEWDPSSGAIKRIAASDGRVVAFSYSGSRISQVTSGGRTWAYDYSSGGLTKVVLPDGSFWSFSPGLTMHYEATGNVPAVRAHCKSPGSQTYPSSGSMVHPSGAMASFTLTPTLHGRSYGHYSCPAQPGASAIETSWETFPASYYTWSLTRKAIAGPGLAAPYVWTYSYGPHNGCYSTGLPSGDPLACHATSPAEKWVEVLDPAGVKSRHVFSNKSGYSEGYLLRVERPGRVETHEYEFGDPGQYYLIAGTSIMPAAGRGSLLSRMNPLRERVIAQDGMKWIWRADAYDAMARPIKVTKSSRPNP